MVPQQKQIDQLAFLFLRKVGFSIAEAFLRLYREEQLQQIPNELICMIKKSEENFVKIQEETDPIMKKLLIIQTEIEDACLLLKLQQHFSNLQK